MNDALTLPNLRIEFPDASPAALYDVVCERLKMDERWATSPWTACSNWLDMFANAPTSYVAH